MDPPDERDEELETLAAIYPELKISDHDQYSISLELAVTPSTPLLVRFIPETEKHCIIDINGKTVTNGIAHIERDVLLSHLPSLCLELELPASYPLHSPPKIRLSTAQSWIPVDKLKELETELEKLWEEYGHCQVLYIYIDYLQQCAERGFDLSQSAEGCLTLPTTQEQDLVNFDEATRLAVFEAGTYDCGVCLEPKKGSACHRMKRCADVFCKDCLKDFYNNAISEGDVTSIRCLAPDCSLKKSKKRKAAERTLHPRELLAIGIDEKAVRRYVEMKRKKKLEADKSTVYCPRTWCQEPARSAKYPPTPADLATFVDSEDSSSSEEEDERKKQDGSKCTPLSQLDPSKYGDTRLTNPSGKPSSKPTQSLRCLSKQLNQRKLADRIPADPADRLAICEKCQLAFCRVCYMGWHGPFARCFPRSKSPSAEPHFLSHFTATRAIVTDQACHILDPGELSAEEKASYDYIRQHTSPCPTCSSPVQKTMGCNHMKCYQCNTHFCYLCGSWLNGENPYQHFNKLGEPCYQMLWELEEGDKGQAPEGGFGGARGWEQLAIEAAGEADAQAAAADVAGAQAEEGEVQAVDRDADARPEPRLVVDMGPVNDRALRWLALAQWRQPREIHRAQQRLFPALPPAEAAAQAVRHHERHHGGRGNPQINGNANGRMRRRPAANEEERQQQELQRFLELAERDEEEGWDSDELGEEDEGWVIR